MKITISGLAASGKSTIAKMIAKKLRYKHFSVGDMQRELAKELKVDIEELGRLEAKNDNFDRIVDKKIIELGKKKDKFVIDGWLTPHFVPDSYKIFLTIKPDEAVRRRMLQSRTTEQYKNNADAKKKLKQRQDVNRKRWIKFYNYDFMQKKNYDLIIDTTNLTQEQIVKAILENLKIVKKSKNRFREDFS